MAINYQITQSDEFTGASIVFSNGEVKPISSSHERYLELRDYLLNNNEHDETYIRSIIEPARLAEKKLVNLSSRVSRKGGSLFYDGEKLDSALTKHIIRLLDEGGEKGDWKAYVRFLERLQLNPSKKSRKHLFSFIESNGMTISDDGYLVAYKGVQKNGKSVSAGFGIVDGVEYKHANLPNEVGSVIEIPRHMVDDNREVACSVGLHVGAWSYASTFAPRLLTALVDPADVVSVPSDHSDQKVRVAKYIVKELAPEKEYTDLTVTFEKAPKDPVESAWQDYQEDVQAVEDGSLVAPEFNTGLTRDDIATLVNRFGEDYWADYLPASDETLADVLGEVDDEDEEPSDTPIHDSVASGKVVRPEGSRVDEYKEVIRALIKADPNANLRKYRSKRITAGRRLEFTEAAEELGFKL